ncbi:MAG TPA: hypothetical protein VHX68_20470 [Planctomycetaceae bacterium]|jgi:hypothetical protein|nr:hypothetical protein [Planctomycetaceae bacterium]
MSTTVSCPNCSQKLKAPSEAVGKLVRCGCGHSFVLPGESWEESPAAIDSLPELPTRPKKRGAPKSERYPWLTWYLRVARTASIGMAVIGVIVSFLMLVGAILSSGSSPQETGALFTSSVLLFFGSIGQCVATLAGVEFVKVVLDVEANTRSLLEIARQRFERI